MKMGKMIKPFNIWLTGLSGSGKTTLAEKINEYLISLNISNEVLDGDVYRAILSPEAGYTQNERDAFRRKIIFVAKLLNKHEVSCIFSLLSSSKKIRGYAREELNNFIEVYVKCPIEVCVQRDPKGLYKKAKAGKESNIVGIHIPYEEPENPDIIVETHRQGIESCVAAILNKIEKLGFIQSLTVEA